MLRKFAGVTIAACIVALAVAASAPVDAHLAVPAPVAPATTVVESAPPVADADGLASIGQELDAVGRWLAGVDAHEAEVLAAHVEAERLEAERVARAEEARAEAARAEAARAEAAAAAPSGNCAGWGELIAAHFGPQSGKACAVMLCESRGNPNAVSPTNDHGLFQINRRWNHDDFVAFAGSWDRVYEPGTNVAYAADLHARRGWAAWACA